MCEWLARPDLLDACLTVRPCRAQQSLGTQHVTYGVEPEHYEWVGAALIETLATALGDAFDADTKAAYLCVYGESASRLRQSQDEISYSNWPHV